MIGALIVVGKCWQNGRTHHPAFVYRAHVAGGFVSMVAGVVLAVS
ncbi:hypothetical protein KCP76_03270 [Salmonella enterica subsp. enterica serovar Weltevreden]|nr:hypothetical protein KCP76_03270 [Salmonella enterica subsp. enterica serovar Weltevreden]